MQESDWISKVISLMAYFLNPKKQTSFGVIAISTNYMLRTVHTLHSCSGNTSSFDFSGKLKIVSRKFMLCQSMNKLQCVALYYYNQKYVCVLYLLMLRGSEFVFYSPYHIPLDYCDWLSFKFKLWFLCLKKVLLISYIERNVEGKKGKEGHCFLTCTGLQCSLLSWNVIIPFLFHFSFPHIHITFF